MELSPKQQTVEILKKSKKILILSGKEVTGDNLGSSLALSMFLSDLGKSTEIVFSSGIPEIISFLPGLNNIRNSYQSGGGKIIRVSTEKAPIKSMKWQRGEGFLDIILDTDKNLKFEFIEIINGEPKPDVIIILGTPDVEKIDPIYDTNTEMFFEVPIINIDHHAGNEYFGTVNMVDLTATSVAEILVSLSEALGLKISSADIATCLLTGIISETQSFRTQTTTPKSLTVAAQLLAAGARQQEIISNLYKKRPMALLKLWGDMLARLNLDSNYRFAWATVKKENLPEGLSEKDVFEAADELLSNTPDADVILILAETRGGEIAGKLKSKPGNNILDLAKSLGGDGVPTNATFFIKKSTLREAELSVIKEIQEFFSKTGEHPAEREIWDVIDKSGDIIENDSPKIEDDLVGPLSKKAIPDASASEEDLTPNLPPAEVDLGPSDSEESDAIDEALESLQSKSDDKVASFSSIKDIIEIKKRDLQKEEKTEEDIDVFDES